jgi:hypothetical protein
LPPPRREREELVGAGETTALLNSIDWDGARVTATILQAEVGGVDSSEVMSGMVDDVLAAAAEIPLDDESHSLHFDID